MTELSPEARRALPEIVAALRAHGEEIVGRRNGKTVGVAMHTAAEWLDSLSR